MEDSGISYVLVAVDRSADEGQAYTGPKVCLYSGENADLPVDEHEEPWTAALYGGDSDYINQPAESVPAPSWSDPGRRPVFPTA
ncbi:hypothetical protein ACFYOF_20605 [Streptomyces sp. NPDC007148]|uniref:hypothetical protein n=1 Tax=Streptomyces sp. NPDC007148 TaxID=3364775 RepID=UPI0036A33BAB